MDDTVFEALAHRQRRQLLVSLRSREPQHVQELSRVSRELLTADDSFIEEYLTGSLTVESADKALVRMHSVHLPELADEDFIRWDRNTNRVTTGSRFDELVPILELVEDDREDRAVPRTVLVR